MTTEDFLIDDSNNRQTIETIRESLPQLDAVASFALVVEAVNAVNGGALVVATQQEEVLRILDLVSQQQTDALQGLFAAVHVVAQKQIVTLRREAAVLEQPQQVGVLAVNVAADLQGRFDFQQNRLRQENLP